MDGSEQRPIRGFLSSRGECPVAETLRALGGKHKPNILHALSNGEQHFLELTRSLPGISRKVLTEQLRELEKFDLVERVEKNDARRHVGYALTARALALGGIVSQLSAWNEAGLEKFGGLDRGDRPLNPT
jgi:DNA-binding HxlR family transcriptional regulator